MLLDPPFINKARMKTRDVKSSGRRQKAHLMVKPIKYETHKREGDGKGHEGA